MQGPARLLPLVGAYNFRDLGGYRTVDGRSTRWGQLFRSDTLQELSEADVQLLREIGLATIIDLRTPSELARYGRGPLVGEPIGYHHLALIDDDQVMNREGPAESQADLAQRYLHYLEIGKNTLVEALTMVSDQARHPLVFHCAAGKDRTGILAALVLDILGVEREVIVEDYVITASRMDLIVARFLRSENDTAWVASIPQFLLRAEASTMETFLELIDLHHGGSRSWARAAGVSDEALDAMSRLLV